MSTITDPFTDSDDTALQAHQEPGGGLWRQAWDVATANVRQAKIRSNTLRSDGTTSASVGAFLSPWIPDGPDYDVTAELQILSANNAHSGVIGRAVGSAHYMARYAFTSSGQWELSRVNAAGSSLSLGTSADPSAALISSGAWRTVTLKLRGSTISLWVDGVQVITATNTDLTAPGAAGVKLLGTGGDAVGIHLRNFVATDFAASPINVTAPRITITRLPSPGPVGIDTPAQPVPTTTQTLACNTGKWSGRPTSYAYQWQRAGVDIGGATSATYVLATADVATAITCVVTATNASGATAASSNALIPTAIPLPLPKCTADPTITGTRQVGQTLTCSTGTWVNGVTAFTYAWYRNGATIGATTAAYALAAADVGKKITCAVEATNPTGSIRVVARA